MDNFEQFLRVDDLFADFFINCLLVLSIAQDLLCQAFDYLNLEFLFPFVLNSPHLFLNVLEESLNIPVTLESFSSFYSYSSIGLFLGFMNFP